MKIFKGLNYFDFFEKFTNNSDCYQYLMEKKWKDGFTCRKCGCKKAIKGRKWYYKRCHNCRYDESVTAGTLFENVKFPILKAFHLVFRISTKKKGMSTIELAHEYGLEQKTCWLFKRKIQEAMKSSGKHLLTGEVHVDEFTIGGPEKGKPGRSHGKKKLVILATEIRLNTKGKRTLGNAYAEVISDYSEKTIGSFFERKISDEAEIVTDAFATYEALQKKFNIELEYSDSGKSFPEIHCQIMNIKGWLRGIHHKCSKSYAQNYLDEYHFRFNRRNHKNSIFDITIKRFINSSSLTYTKIREQST